MLQEFTEYLHNKWNKKIHVENENTLETKYLSSQENGFPPQSVCQHFCYQTLISKLRKLHWKHFGSETEWWTWEEMRAFFGRNYSDHFYGCYTQYRDGWMHLMLGVLMGAKAQR